MPHTIEYSRRMSRLGIDVGGTFVDLVLADDDGGLVFEKVLAEPADLVGSIVSGVRTLLDRAGISGGEIVEAMHATTRSGRGRTPSRVPGGSH